MVTALSQTLSSDEYRQPEWPGAGTSPSLVFQVPSHLGPVVSQLAELESLRPGWNSYGAPRISWTAINAAIQLLVSYHWDGPLPCVSPTSRGGVQLEWGGDEDGVEVELSSDGSISALVDVNGEMQEHNIVGLSDPLLADALTWAEKLA